MTKLLMFFGLPHLDAGSLVLVLGLAFVACVIFGWIADSIMDSMSFGIAINGVLLLLGGILGLLLLKYSGFQYRLDFVFAAILFSSVSAVMVLLCFAFLRRYL